MINYSCDLCGKECGEKVFSLPIAATWVDQEPCDLMPVEMNLCKKCRIAIYKAIETRASKERMDDLSRFALDIKMNR
jgi:hypothetical protein